MEKYLEILKEKAIIFQGVERTGKTRLMKRIAKEFKNPKWLDYAVFHRGRSRFAFQGLEKNVDLVIIDDCPSNFNWEMFFDVLTNGVTVEKKGESPFEIKPKFIFCTNYPVHFYGDSFTRRFEVIEMGTQFRFYKFRAECFADVIQFFNFSDLKLLEIKTTTMMDGITPIPDVEVEFSIMSEKSIDEDILHLREILQDIEDGHVMWQTLNTLSDYSGERNFDIV